MTPEQALLICPQHGWMSHTFLHEAAHAIMAIDRELPFTRITVGTPEYFEPTHVGREVAGGLHVPQPVSDWIQKDPLASYEMMIAGKVCEDGAFGHHLDGSWHGDLALWCIGMGLSEYSLDLVEEALGKPILDVEAGVREHLVVQYPRAKAIVTAMSGIADGSGRTTLSYDEGPWSMERDEVLAVAGPLL
jgi:hypothetical protein